MKPRQAGERSRQSGQHLGRIALLHLKQQGGHPFYLEMIEHALVEFVVGRHCVFGRLPEQGICPIEDLFDPDQNSAEVIS